MNIQFHYIDWYKDRINEILDESKKFPSLILQSEIEKLPINSENWFFNIIPSNHDLDIQFLDVDQHDIDHTIESINYIDNLYLKIENTDLIKAVPIEENIEENIQFMENIDIEYFTSDYFAWNIILRTTQHQNQFMYNCFPVINEDELFLTYKNHISELISARCFEETFNYLFESSCHLLEEIEQASLIDIPDKIDVTYPFQLLDFNRKLVEYALNSSNDMDITDRNEKLEEINLILYDTKKIDIEDSIYEENKNNLSTIEGPVLPMALIDMNSIPFDLKETNVEVPQESDESFANNFVEENEKYVKSIWQKETIHKDPTIQSIPQITFDLYHSSYDKQFSLMEEIIKLTKEIPLIKLELRLPFLPLFEISPHMYYSELTKPDLFFRPQLINEEFNYNVSSSSITSKLLDEEKKLPVNDILWDDIKSHALVFIDPFSTFKNSFESVEFYKQILYKEFEETFNIEADITAFNEQSDLNELNQVSKDPLIEESVHDSLSDFMRTRGVNKVKEKVYLKYPNLDNLSQEAASRSIGKSCLFICPSISYTMLVFLQMIVEIYYDSKLTKILLFCENDNRIEETFNYLINFFKISPSNTSIISTLKSKDTNLIPKDTRILISSPDRLTSIVEWINYKEIHIFIICSQNSFEFPSTFLLPCNNLVVILKSRNIVHFTYTVHKPELHNYSELRIYLEYLGIQRVVCIPSSYVPEIIPTIYYLDLTEQVMRLVDLTHEYIEGMLEYVDGMKDYDDHNKLKLAVSSIVSKLQSISDEDEKNNLCYSLKKFLSFHTLKRVYENLIDEGIDAASSYMIGAIKQYSHFISDIMEDLNTAFELSVAEIKAGLYYAHPKIPFISSLIQDETKKIRKMNLKTLIIIEKGPNRIVESLKKTMPTKTISLLDDFTEEMITYVLRNTDIVLITYNSLTKKLDNTNMKSIFMSNFQLIIEWKNMNLVFPCDNLSNEQKHIKLMVNDPYSDSATKSQRIEFNNLIESLRITFSSTTSPNHHFIIDFASIQKFSFQNPEKSIEVEDKKLNYIHHENTMIHVLMNDAMFCEHMILKSMKNANIIPHSSSLPYEQIILDENHCVLYQENISEEEMTKTIYNASYISYKYKKALILLLLDETEFRECNILLARFCTKISHLNRKEGTCRFIIRFLTSQNQIGESILKFSKEITSSYSLSLEEWCSMNSPLVLRANHSSITSNFLSYLPYCDPFRAQIILKKTTTLGYLLQMKKDSLFKFLSERIPTRNIEPLIECFEHKIGSSKFLRPKRQRDNNLIELNPKRRAINLALN